MNYIRHCFHDWELPYMKSEINELIEAEKILDTKIRRVFNNYWGGRYSGATADGCERLERAEAKAWEFERAKRYVDNLETYKQRFTDIINICDTTFNNIKLDKSSVTHIWYQEQIVKEYNDIKEKIIEMSMTECKSEYDWILLTRLFITHIYREYASFLEYDRLITLTNKAEISEKDAYAIIIYLIDKQQTTFRVGLDNYKDIDHTLIATKVMNQFAVKHSIRPEDSLEVFKKYLGPGDLPNKLFNAYMPC